MSEASISLTQRRPPATATTTPPTAAVQHPPSPPLPPPPPPAPLQTALTGTKRVAVAPVPAAVTNAVTVVPGTNTVGDEKTALALATTRQLFPFLEQPAVLNELRGQIAHPLVSPSQYAALKSIFTGFNVVMVGAEASGKRWVQTTAEDALTKLMNKRVTTLPDNFLTLEGKDDDGAASLSPTIGDKLAQVDEQLVKSDVLIVHDLSRQLGRATRILAFLDGLCRYVRKLDCERKAHSSASLTKLQTCDIGKQSFGGLQIIAICESASPAPWKHRRVHPYVHTIVMST